MNAVFPALVENNFQIIWQTGPWDFTKYKKYASDSVSVNAFINQMDEAYAISDLVISRAGAITLSEITVCGKPSIVIPFPQAAGDHQTKNAEALKNTDAAIMIHQKDLNNDDFIRIITDLLQDEKRLKVMSEKSRSIGKPEATELIIDKILEAMKY
jgi:UDP-N-acetylglucosamine--N-acetylmuramyl-(pentapeptide) pyrophosphoryl-undecaprenol N-acetylglucosamine transferase